MFFLHLLIFNYGFIRLQERKNSNLGFDQQLVIVTSPASYYCSC